MSLRGRRPRLQRVQNTLKKHNKTLAQPEAHRFALEREGGDCLQSRTMKLEILSEGFVRRCEPGRIAAQPRCAVTADDDVVCHYVMQSKLGQNDFEPWWSRSSDGGNAWTHERLWPHLRQRWSIIGAAGSGPKGELVWFGSRFSIDQPGESFWCDATQGLKANDMIWGRSLDGGRTWSEPVAIPHPIPGSAEVCTPMCVTRRGEWLGCYAPYNTFDPDLKVPRNQVIALASADEGKTWQHSAMLRFPHPDSTAAGSSVAELSDGRLLGVAWHINEMFPSDPPNAYALSLDGGRSWGPTLSTEILGQSTGLAPLPYGRVLFIYNQRKHGEIGVWLALAKPTETDFGLIANQIIWRAERPTLHGTSGKHSEWTDLAFGAPSIVVLPDGKLLATLWCHQPSGTGIRYVVLRGRGPAAQSSPASGAAKSA